MARSRRRRALPSEPILLEVHDLSHDGRGVGRHIEGELAGKTTFVHGALPGERVSARLIGRNRQFDEAIGLEVIEPSPDRVEAQCPFFDHCGGCVLQHLSPSVQRQWKHKRLVDNIERLGQVSPQRWAEPIEGPVWEYRRRARLSVRHVAGKGRVLVGFREPQGRYVADVDHCQVLHPKFSNTLEDLSSLMGELSVKDAIPQIEIACGDQDAAMIIRHLAPLQSDDVMVLKAWSQAHDVAIYLQPKGPDTIHRLWPADHTLSYTLPAQGLRFEFKPEQFVQVNAKINEQLIERALDYLKLSNTDRVLDLFCGLGNFTLPMAQQAGHVTGVEGMAELIDQARHNAKLNDLVNVDFHVADLSEDPSGASWLAGGYSHVLIDPPRSGAEAMLPYIAATGARSLVYVSCNPATLARDAGQLVNRYGYRLIEAGIADMFPHTAHVESIALFERAS